MSENRLPDYIDHILQAAADACTFVEGLGKNDFLEDKRTQQAVIMSLIVIGEAAAKVMDNYAEFTRAHPEVPWRSMRNMHAQSHGPRLFRHRPQCGVGNDTRMATGIAGTTARRVPW